MDEWDKALVAFESALRHNPNSQKSLHSLGRLLLDRDQFGPALEVFQRLLTVIKSSGTILIGKKEEILAEMALCWLGMEDLGKAAVFIQKAVQLTNEETKEEEEEEEEEEEKEKVIEKDDEEEEEEEEEKKGKEKEKIHCNTETKSKSKTNE